MLSCQSRPLKVIRTKAVTNHKNFKRRNFIEDNISSSAISDDSSDDCNSECNNMPIKVMSMRSSSKAKKRSKLSVKRSESLEEKKATDEVVQESSTSHIALTEEGTQDFSSEEDLKIQEQTKVQEKAKSESQFILEKHSTEFLKKQLTDKVAILECLLNNVKQGKLEPSDEVSEDIYCKYEFINQVQEILTTRSKVEKEETLSDSSPAEGTLTAKQRKNKKKKDAKKKCKQKNQ